MRERLLLRLLAPALATPQVRRILDSINGRRLGIDVRDLDLRWVLVMEADGLRLADGVAEATVSGSATDLLLLASRLEDADTLFFQRRLMLTGDTELGLTVRNLLDRLPWESFPLGSRILLQRGARVARDARHAYRVHHGEVA
ncbi:MAG TPA: SCP2 sterol-binding domain-containing protein [Pseudoxanthomonas sp.]